MSETKKRATSEIQAGTTSERRRIDADRARGLVEAALDHHNPLNTQFGAQILVDAARVYAILSTQADQ